MRLQFKLHTARTEESTVFVCTVVDDVEDNVDLFLLLLFIIILPFIPFSSI